LRYNKAEDAYYVQIIIIPAFLTSIPAKAIWILWQWKTTSIDQLKQSESYGNERQLQLTQSVILRKPHCLKLSAKNMHSNGQPLKYHIFCRVHWALNSGSKRLNLVT